MMHVSMRRFLAKQKLNTDLQGLRAQFVQTMTFLDVNIRSTGRFNIFIDGLIVYRRNPFDLHVHDFV